MSIAAVDKEAVRVMAIGQAYPSGSDTLRPKTTGKRLRCSWTTTVSVGIEGKIDRPGVIAQLLKLMCVEMVSQRAGDIAKAGLP